MRSFEFWMVFWRCSRRRSKEVRFLNIYFLQLRDVVLGGMDYFGQVVFSGRGQFLESYGCDLLVFNIFSSRKSSCICFVGGASSIFQDSLQFIFWVVQRYTLYGVGFIFLGIGFLKFYFLVRFFFIFVFRVRIRGGVLVFFINFFL